MILEPNDPSDKTPQDPNKGCNCVPASYCERKRNISCSWTFAKDSSSESEFNLHLASDLEISDEDEENVIESENEDSEWCV